jgi:subtilisin family serine protease
MRTRRFVLAPAPVLALLAACSPDAGVLTNPTGPSAAATAPGSGTYIVVVQDGARPAAVARSHGITPIYTYTLALNGFAGPLTEGQRADLARDPQVRLISADQTAALIEPVNGGQFQCCVVAEPVPQLVTWNMIRVGVDASATAAVDGIDTDLDVDIGIIDTGIDPTHAEFVPLAGGKRFVKGPGDDFSDCYGHGTHVAGIAAARDNARGVVGVAPGARLWSLRVFQCGGVAFFSDIIASLDWSVANGMEVVNMSLGGGGRDDGNCGFTNGDVFHQAVCRTVAAGVTVVVAAGNSAADAAFTTPAAYDEVITVSATDSTDALASFSNFGADVDLAAPGRRVLSTYIDGQYVHLSGTSMASPHVAGAAALLIASSRQRLSPAQVKQTLIRNAKGTARNDPDGHPDPVVYVGRF